jgi:cytidylate kinase
MNKRIVLVIGGPGKSGSSTIAKMLSEHFQVEHVHGGNLFREQARVRGYKSLEDYYRDANIDEIKELDKEVDNELREYANRGGVVIESKVFAGIATKENISCFAKIWVDADLDTRVYRAVEKEGISNPIAKWIRKRQIKKDLVLRYEIDRLRYKEMYGLDYDNPEKYNDFVIDSSGQTPDQTFNLIINYLKDAGNKKEWE